jgi:hypothetical protein
MKKAVQDVKEELNKHGKSQQQTNKKKYQIKTLETQSSLNQIKITGWTK